MTRPRRLVYTILEVAFPIALLGALWVITEDSKSFYFPPLSDVAETFADNWLFERWAVDVLPSLGRMALGFAIALVAGVLGGLVLGSTHVARKLADPIVTFLRCIPGAALLPFGVLVFGIGDDMKVFVIAFVCVWPVLLNTTDGVDDVETTMLETAAIFKIRGLRRLIMVMIPSASPRIFAGIRTSVALALIMMIISEMVASSNGLGHFVLQAQRTFGILNMWSGIVLLGLLGYVLSVSFSLLEGRVLRWFFVTR